MGYSAEYRKAAEKYLDSQTPAVQIRIMDAVDSLPAGNVKKLTGRDGYRLTVGKYRILFNYTDKVTRDGDIVIEVVLIGARGDVYKK